MIEKYSYTKVVTMFEELQADAAEWIAEYREISDYLLPGRGIYQTYSKPRKRKLTSPKTINTAAEDAMYVLTSGISGALTSPARPWFDFRWANREIDSIEVLKAWLQESTLRMHKFLHASNFYSAINSFFEEHIGFGTACMYIGEDSEDDLEDEVAPFRFEVLTAGEYYFSVDSTGKPSLFFRTIFWTPSQVVDRFPKAEADVKRIIDTNSPGSRTPYLTILEIVVKEEFEGKPYTRIFYLRDADKTNEAGDSKTPLEVSGFHEFPYPLARWSTIGSDTLGIGPGSKALPDIKRLQEMEKSGLMATHKMLDPPVLAPSRLRGKVTTLPGGRNYSINPNEKISELYSMKFDLQAAGVQIERVEKRIERKFYNEVFITGSRDPNASPLRTGEVNARELDKMTRLGPIVTRLGHEFFQPFLTRCFNIAQRKNLLPEIPPEFKQIAGKFNIIFTSPLATAQNAVALQGIQSFLGFIGNAAQFSPEVMDNVDIDETARDFADITGVRLGILRPLEEVKKLREQRAADQKASQEAEQQRTLAQQIPKAGLDAANTRKANADAGLTLIEGQQKQVEAGL